MNTKDTTKAIHERLSAIYSLAAIQDRILVAADIGQIDEDISNSFVYSGLSTAAKILANDAILLCEKLEKGDDD